MAPVGSYPPSSSSDAAAGVRTQTRASPLWFRATLTAAGISAVAASVRRALRGHPPRRLRAGAARVTPRRRGRCSRASTASSCTATRRSGTAPSGLPRCRSGDLATELTVPPRSASRPNSRAPQGSRGRRSPASHGDAGVPVAMTHRARSADHASAAGARPDDRRWRTRSAILSSPQVGASERSPRRACGGPR